MLRLLRPLYHLLVLQELAAYISEQKLLRPGDRLGVAVSGGADSTALLRALLELRGDLGIVLSVVHLHHGIRGAAADEDAAFVRRLAGDHELPLHLEHVDVPAIAEQRGLSLETAARELRYMYFHRMLKAGAVDKVATAHTLDDQAETVLLRLVRGTASSGLAGILPVRDSGETLEGRIIRPFLATTRQQIESYLRGVNQPWRDDASNSDRRHLRNRVRHDLLPMLERGYNPSVKQLLANLAEVSRGEEEVWAASVGRLLGETAEIGESGARVCRGKLNEQPLAVRRRLMAAVLDRLRIPVGFKEIDGLVNAGETRAASFQLASGWEVVFDREFLLIRPFSSGSTAREYSYLLAVPGAVEIPETGQILRTWMRDSSSGAGYNPATSLARERLMLPLCVRNWRPGDRYWPWGGKQPEKLKRLFQRKRIPSPVRSQWPVVLSGESIIWVPGFPVAHDFAASDGAAVCIEAVERD